MVEILKTVVNFLISLFSGELPIVYYIWVVILLVAHSIQSILNYSLFKKKEKFDKHIAEELSAFGITLIGGILLSKFFAFIIEDSVINQTELTHYYVSLIILTIFVVICCVKDLIEKLIKNKNRTLFTFLIVSLVTSIFSFKLLLPLTGESFILAESFRTTLIILVTGTIVLLIGLEEKYVNEK